MESVLSTSQLSILPASHMPASMSYRPRILLALPYALFSWLSAGLYCRPASCSTAGAWHYLYSPSTSGTVPYTHWPSSYAKSDLPAEGVLNTASSALESMAYVQSKVYCSLYVLSTGSSAYVFSINYWTWMGLVNLSIIWSRETEMHSCCDVVLLTLLEANLYAEGDSLLLCVHLSPSAASSLSSSLPLASLPTSTNS